MRTQQREAAARAERPIAQLTALLFNINRGKDAKVLTERDWWIYGTLDPELSGDSLSPAVVAVMLAYVLSASCQTSCWPPGTLRRLRPTPQAAHPTAERSGPTVGGSGCWRQPGRAATSAAASSAAMASTLAPSRSAT